jgi:hypothetical protein
VKNCINFAKSNIKNSSTLLFGLVCSNVFGTNCLRSSISQSNLYEDVRSQISEDLGWSSSEFDSDSTTDYENPSDFDIIDKPLPLTPKEMARSPAEVR